MRDSPLTQSWRWLVALALVAIATVVTLSNTLSHQWFWSIPPVSLEPLIQLRQSGLDLPGWQTQSQRVIQVGGHKWSFQALEPEPGTSPTLAPDTLLPYLLLLRPQTSHADQPQVEWIDIDGVQSWSVEQRQTLEFVVKPSGAAAPALEHTFKSTAQFFLGRNLQQTYAVLQWYAWAQGGSPTPGRWFLADHVAQWRDRHSLPWVAVCVLIPIDPFAESSSVKAIASQLGQLVHAALVPLLTRAA